MFGISTLFVRQLEIVMTEYSSIADRVRAHILSGVRECHTTIHPSQHFIMNALLAIATSFIHPKNGLNRFCANGTCSRTEKDGGGALKVFSVCRWSLYYSSQCQNE